MKFNFNDEVQCSVEWQEQTEDSWLNGINPIRRCEVCRKKKVVVVVEKEEKKLKTITLISDFPWKPLFTLHQLGIRKRLLFISLQQFFPSYFAFWKD